jgi:hypothetical protein
VRALVLGILAAVAGCGHGTPDEPAIPPGVVFTYPRDHQVDVPVGARTIISFSDPTAGDATPRIAGPDGDLAITTSVVGAGKTVAIESAGYAPATTYAVYLDDGDPVFRFTTRNDRPISGPPTVLAVNGADPNAPSLLDTSTIRLVFSEPLDPRTVVAEPGAVELLDASGSAVPATLLAKGIHVVVDPASPLVAGEGYELRLGEQLADLGGEHLAATSIHFTPAASGASTPGTFRTRVDGDPDAAIQRTDAANVMDLASPLIGAATSTVRPGAIATELGDPTALGGPIAFTIPRGQRFVVSGLDVQLGGAVPSGLATGDIQIELLADGNGVMERNAFRPPDTLPDNERSPLLVDLSIDMAIYATDPTGNAVLAQTVLGGHLTGLAMTDEGALALEAFGAIDFNLLGIANAPTNFVLDLISDPSAVPVVDTQAPALVSSLPAADSHALAPDDGIELVFDEPIDVDRARAGGITLRDAAGAAIPCTIEPHGSVAVLRPRTTLPDGADLHVELTDVADLAGNVMAPVSFAVGTPLVVHTDVPLTALAIHPGAPCALTGASPTLAGRCVGGNPNDDGYLPFTLAADEPVTVVFDQPLRADTATLATTCTTGSFRVLRVDDTGACVEPVPGTLLRHRRDLAFVPDRPWQAGEHYRVQLVSGPDASCDAGELCGANGHAASFDPLRGTTAAGGPDLVVDFVATPPTGRATLIASASPYADINGSGTVDTGESAPDTNRVALRIAGTTGVLGSATFNGADCVPETPEVEACMYIAGAIPAQLGDVRTDCALPDGTTEPICVPVAMTPQTMYSTSIAMTATALGIGIAADTGMSVMRMRDRDPLEGYIVERDGKPTMIAALALYMDAPDMSLPLSQHDLHSKPLAVLLEGPVTFRADGRLALALSNVADVPISVGINAPLGISGAVNLVVPAGDMSLQLVTPPQRARLP